MGERRPRFPAEGTAAVRGPRRRHRGSVPAPVALAAALLFGSGCGAGQLAPTSVQVTATNGAEGRVGSVLVRDAQLAAAERPVTGDALHGAGANVPLKLTIVNDATAAGPGSRPDRLVAVTSPVFTSTRIAGDARVADGQSLAAGYPGPVSSMPASGTGRIEVTMLGAREPLRAGMTYPVVFTFERAGPLALRLPVENPQFVVPRADGDPRTSR